MESFHLRAALSQVESGFNSSSVGERRQGADLSETGTLQAAGEGAAEYRRAGQRCVDKFVNHTDWGTGIWIGLDAEGQVWPSRGMGGWDLRFPVWRRSAGGDTFWFVALRGGGSEIKVKTSRTEKVRELQARRLAGSAR